MEARMARKTSLTTVVVLLATVLVLAACGRERTEDVQSIMEQPKTFVGSVNCRGCHLEHYDSWKMTLHSRMLIDVRENPLAIVADMNPDLIRADLEKIQDKLKVPVEDVYIPSRDEILYVIGTQWKQRYVVQRDGTYHVAPVQYNIETKRWVNYYEDAWDERDWLVRCGGCHATGVDLPSYTFNEPSIGCEACHGPGSQHAALPRDAVFERRETIVNPAKMTAGIAVQICGSCHTRGNSKHPDYKEAGWPVGSRREWCWSRSTPAPLTGRHAPPLSRLRLPFAPPAVYRLDPVQACRARRDLHVLPCRAPPGHIAPTRFQTKEAGSSQCLSCHTMISANRAHSIHSFGNCLGCHMPRIASTAEPNDIRSHTFDAGLPWTP
jgi:hypothetical protein